MNPKDSEPVDTFAGGGGSALRSIAVHLRSRISLRFAAQLCISFLILTAAGAAQSKPGEQKPKDQEQYKIGVEVNMVTVPVTVRKPEGGFIKGLPMSAFHIMEDGVEQQIATFAQEGVPTRVAIVLDTSGSVRSEWGTIKLATGKFVENLKPDDQFSIVTFNEETRLKMDWGDKSDRLSAVLTSVYCKGVTNLWDALWVVSNQLFKGIQEKKAIIIMTDGLDNNSSVSYKEALDTAVRSEAMVYVVSKTEAVRESILYQLSQAGIYNGIPHEEFVQADLALQKLSYETGGRVLYPNSFGQLNDIYAEVNEELRNQYTLGYVSTNQIKDGGYRHIQVRVDTPNAVVRARPGYYARNEIPGRQY